MLYPTELRAPKFFSACSIKGKRLPVAADRQPFYQRQPKSANIFLQNKSTFLPSLLGFVLQEFFQFFL